LFISRKEGLLKIWKLVSGILSIVFFAFVAFQSCAAGMSDALQDVNGTGGAAGVIVSILLLAGGIISIVARESTSKGLDIALIIIFGLAALTGFSMYGSYSDLVIWSAWCLICAVLAMVSLIKNRKAAAPEE
jgi:hypothetical protein